MPTQKHWINILFNIIEILKKHILYHQNREIDNNADLGKMDHLSLY